MASFTSTLPRRTRLLLAVVATNEIRARKGTSNSDPASSWAMRRLWRL
jgi:hypothetical protein